MSKSSFKVTKESVQDELDEFNVVMTPSAIPDLTELSNIILELLDFIETENMVTMENKFLDEYKLANTIEDTATKNENKLQKVNQELPEYDKLLQESLESKRRVTKLRKSADKKKEEYEALVYGKFNSKLPMKIISLLVEPERYDNLNELLDMFEVLKDVKSGKKNIEEEAEKFGEKNRSKYVYPKFGSKQNFIDAMSKPTKPK